MLKIKIPFYIHFILYTIFVFYAVHISLHGNCGKLMMRNIVNVAGLADAAAALQREANLPRSITPPNVLPAQPCVFSSPHLASPRIVSFTLH